MINQVPIVDLFSGPGGLAEGFASFRDTRGRLRFNVVLSVEMEPTAHRTLRLRSFLRKFKSGFPKDYYDFLNGDKICEPDWASLYPCEWQKACDETQCLALGTPKANSVVRRRIKRIRSLHGDRTVLVGGPPCQPYSLAGRSRNAGNALYDPANDKRQLLYLEYAEILQQLQPAIAIMENVTGLLSASHAGRSIFSDVLRTLTMAGGKDQYQIYSLASLHENRSWKDGLLPKDFLIRAEEHGVPQKRHRVFVVCVRRDVASTLRSNPLPALAQSYRMVSVHDAIGAMPMLRSRLSRDDGDASWQRAVKKAHNLIERNTGFMPPDMERKFHQALGHALISTTGAVLPFRDAQGNTGFPDTCPSHLRNQIFDSEITQLPNHETRTHVDKDIARYLYAAAYAQASGKSPKTGDFPRALAAKHKSWNTGKFVDRFRVQLLDRPSTTITSHIAKDGHYFIHPDPAQCRSLTVREAARLQTFPDNYFFHGSRTQQYVQVGNAVPPYLAMQIAEKVSDVIDRIPPTPNKKFTVRRPVKTEQRLDSGSVSSPLCAQIAND